MYSYATMATQKLTFPSKEKMIEQFEKEEHLNYFMEKGVMSSICEYVAGQTKIMLGVNMAIELAFADHMDVFKDATPMSLMMYKDTVKEAVLNCVV